MVYIGGVRLGKREDLLITYRSMGQPVLPSSVLCDRSSAIVRSGGGKARLSFWGGITLFSIPVSKSQSVASGCIDP